MKTKLSYLIVIALSLGLGSTALGQNRKKVKPKAKPKVEAQTAPETTVDELASDAAPSYSEDSKPKESLWSKPDNFAVRSELWQPGDNRHAIVPHFLYLSVSGDKKISTVDYSLNLSGWNLGASYFYGISDHMTAGLSWGMSQSTTKAKVLSTETETKNEGMTDVSGIFRGRNPMGSMTLYYGAVLGWSPGDSTYNSNDKKGNSYSGGFSIKPNIGIAADLNNFRLGGDLSYTYRGERTDKTEPAGTTTKITGGNITTLSVFGEAPMGTMTLGGELMVMAAEKSKYKVNNTESESESSTGFGVKAYGSFGVAEDISLVPALGYVSTEAKLGTLGSMTLSGLLAQFEARIVF